MQDEILSNTVQAISIIDVPDVSKVDWPEKENIRQELGRFYYAYKNLIKLWEEKQEYHYVHLGDVLSFMFGSFPK